jgi:hypothetical protein
MPPQTPIRTLGDFLAHPGYTLSAHCLECQHAEPLDVRRLVARYGGNIEARELAPLQLLSGAAHSARHDNASGPLATAWQGRDRGREFLRCDVRGWIGLGLISKLFTRKIRQRGRHFGSQRRRISGGYHSD